LPGSAHRELKRSILPGSSEYAVARPSSIGHQYDAREIPRGVRPEQRADADAGFVEVQQFRQALHLDALLALQPIDFRCRHHLDPRINTRLRTNTPRVSTCSLPWRCRCTSRAIRRTVSSPPPARSPPARCASCQRPTPGSNCRRRSHVGYEVTSRRLSNRIRRTTGVRGQPIQTFG